MVSTEIRLRSRFRYALELGERSSSRSVVDQGPMCTTLFNTEVSGELRDSLFRFFGQEDMLINTGRENGTGNGPRSGPPNAVSNAGITAKLVSVEY